MLLPFRLLQRTASSPDGSRDGTVRLGLPVCLQYATGLHKDRLRNDGDSDLVGERVCVMFK